MMELSDKGIRQLKETKLLRLINFGRGWLQILEGLVMVAALGFYWPPWTLRANAWVLRNSRRLWV